MNFKSLKFFVISIGILSSLSIQSCKKNDSSTSNNFVNATVNGSSFSSTKARAISSNGLFAVAGAVQTKADTTAISIVFSKNVTLNAVRKFNDNTSGLLYIDSKTQTIYGTDSTKKATGTYTITSFNTKDSSLGGTFSGTLVDMKGTSTMTITNGSFFSKIVPYTSAGLALDKPKSPLGLTKILFPNF